MARQIGTVLGVAGLVAALSRVVPGDPVTAFRHGIALIVALFAGAGLVSAGLLTAGPRRTGDAQAAGAFPDRQ